MSDDDVATDTNVESLVSRVEELFIQHVDAVFTVARRMLWNRADAEDVVQATFLKAAIHLDQLNAPERPRPWLLKIAYHDSIAVLRRRRDVPTDPAALPETQSSALGPADAAVATAVSRLVTEALASLDPTERAAVVLRDVQELPMREIAEVLDIGLSAAKMRVHRGRASLRTILAEEVADAM